MPNDTEIRVRLVVAEESLQEAKLAMEYIEKLKANTEKRIKILSGLIDGYVSHLGTNG